MTYYEKDFQRNFNKWAKYNIKNTSVFELKITKGNSLSFSAIKEHQENSLYVAKHGKFIFKIPDDSIGTKPLDSFAIINSEAYVVIMFNAPQKGFIMIDIDAWLKIKKTSDRKSITLGQALEIGSLNYLA